MKVWNFNAGPAALPVEVLRHMQQGLLNFHDSGLSLLEMSHRGQHYLEVHRQSIQSLRDLLSIPEEFDVLLLGGGATLQFAMVPLNLLGRGAKARFVLSGSWAKKAWDDAQRVGETGLLFDGRADGFTRLPADIQLPSVTDTAYVHLTSNETIDGLQWQTLPERGGAPVVVDMSSDIASRHIPWADVDLVYAGAQKNLGPAGVTVVVVRRALLPRCTEDLPAYLSYHSHARQHSLYNTPPVFAVQMLGLQLKWMIEQGGVPFFQQASQRKAEALYRVIDQSEGFYFNPVAPPHRSRMNVIFRLANRNLEDVFLAEAEAEGFVGLRGHRSKGGVRASLYNAVSEQAVRALADFMLCFLRSRR